MESLSENQINRKQLVVSVENDVTQVIISPVQHLNVGKIPLLSLSVTHEIQLNESTKKVIMDLSENILVVKKYSYH